MKIEHDGETFEVYATRDEAIAREIREPLSSSPDGADAYDAEAIAEAMIELFSPAWRDAEDDDAPRDGNRTGYRVRAEFRDDPDRFYALAEQHEQASDDAR